jgi:hydroxymethylbilane synthase
MLHAVGQGALGIECRADDDSLIAVLGQISCGPVMAAVTAERSLLRELRAGCHAPVGVRSQVEDSGAVQLEGVVLTPDGERRIAAEASGTADGAAAVGIEVASQLKADGAGEILSA